MEVTEVTAKAMKVDELKSALTAKGCTFNRSDKKADLLEKLLATLHSEDTKDITPGIEQDHKNPSEAMEEISTEQTNGMSCIYCFTFHNFSSFFYSLYYSFIFSLLCRQRSPPLALAIKRSLFDISRRDQRSRGEDQYASR